MRHSLLSLSLTGALLAASACTVPVQTPGGNGAGSGKTPTATTAKPSYPAGIVMGTVYAPPGVISAGGGNIIGQAGSNIIGQAGSNVVSAGGANANRRVTALKQSTLAGCEVFVADASGNPIPGLPHGRTDGNGKFTLTEVPAGYSFLVVALVKTAQGEGASLKTLAKVTTLGTTVELGMASTLVAAAAVEGRTDALGEFNQATFQRAVETTNRNLTNDDLPDLADGNAVLAWMKALASRVADLQSSVDQLKSDLSQVKQELADIKAELAKRASPTPEPSVKVVVSQPPLLDSPAPIASASTASSPTPTPSPTPSAAASAAPSAAPGPGVTVSTMAGSSSTTSMKGLAVDGSGSAFIAETTNKHIRKVLSDGSSVTLAPTFNGLNDVVVDAQGNVYASDGGNRRIYKITPDGTFTTLAGSGGMTLADGTGAAATFINPRGLALVTGGFLVVDQSDNGADSRLRRVGFDGVVTTISGASGPVPLEGAGELFDVAADGQGNTYLAQPGLNRILKIASDGSTSVLAGGTQGSADGTGAAAQFSGPMGIAVDGQGNVIVADKDNNRIRKVTPAGVVTTLAGSTYGSDDGPGAQAKFASPFDVEVDSASGKIYVCESGGRRVRILTITP